MGWPGLCQGLSPWKKLQLLGGGCGLAGLLCTMLCIGELLTLSAAAAGWLVGAGRWVGVGCWVGVGSGLRWTGAGLLLTEVGSSSGSSSMSSQSGRQYADGGPSGWASAGAWGSSGCGSPGSWGTSGAAVAGCPRGGKGKRSPRCRSPHSTWRLIQSMFSPAL